MAKLDQFLRIKFILDFLESRKQGATYREVFEHLQNKLTDYDLAFCEKTFLRDRAFIRESLNIDIKFKRSTMTYKIVEEDANDSSAILDNLLLLNAYKQIDNHSEIMIFEKRKSRGLENLNGILSAIQNCKIITFNYTKHWENIPYRKVLEPYALKEFKNRWYLIANEVDDKDFFLKTFGLDRISEFQLKAKTFKKQNVDIDQLFVNSFGIISTLNEIPETIVLSFDYEQGKFIKTLPIHHSQKVLIDNDSEYRIELTLVPTYDFYQELLTHTGRMRIISPEVVKAEYFKFINYAKELQFL